MIDAIFVFLNFGLFLGIVIYYFRKNLLNLIKNKLEIKKATRRDLKDQAMAASAEYRALQEQLEYQKTLYVALGKKLSTWQTAIALDEQKETLARHSYEAKIRKQLEQQQSYLQTTQIISDVFPAAFDSGIHQLQAYFSDQKHCADYNQQILKLLEKH